MTTKTAAMVTVGDAQRLLDLYHPDVPLTVKLPDGTRLGITGLIMEHHLGVLDTVTLTAQTTKNPAGELVAPITL